MKWFLILFCLTAFVLESAGQMNGQNQGGANMPFLINFSPLSDSTPDDSLSGGAWYNRFELVTGDSGWVALTNRLEVSVNISSPPIESWIVEKQAGGSLVPIVQLTNLIANPDGSYYFYQSLLLTTNQVYSLLATNWYVAVDFGDSNYLGSLTPDYFLANGPAVSIESPGLGKLLGPKYIYTVIATNNHNVRMVFEATDVVDPFYLPMQYEWKGYNNSVYWQNDLVFTAAGIRAANVFNLGRYSIRLQVRDAILAGPPTYATLNIVKPGQIISDMQSWIQWATIPKAQKRILAATLSIATMGFERGYPNLGCVELELFRKQLKAFKVSAEDTDVFSDRAQFIVNAFIKMPDRPLPRQFPHQAQPR